jgi:hypothetical protein
MNKFEFTSNKENIMDELETINSLLTERRGKDDRRYFWMKTKFPLVDDTELVVKKDRRYRPDRRIAKIKVTRHIYYASKSLPTKDYSL